MGHVDLHNEGGVHYRPEFTRKQSVDHESHDSMTNPAMSASRSAPIDIYLHPTWTYDIP